MKGSRFICILFIVSALIASDDNRQATASAACADQKYDLYFMVEASSYIGQANVRIARSFLKKILESFTLGAENTQVSITSYGKEVKNQLSLAKSRDPAQVKKALKRLRADKGYGIWTHNFIDYANKNLFTSQQGRRSDVPAICILVTGYTFSGNYLKVSKELKQNCRVIVVGVKYYRLVQLFAVASKPTSKHALYSRKYSDIINKVDSVTKVICVPPLAAPHLQKKAILHDSITVEWPEQPNAIGFDALLRPRKGPRRVSKKLGLTGTSVTFTGLKESTQYFLYVWALDKEGDRGPQATLLITTGIKAPVIEIDESSISKTSVTVRWDRFLRGGLSNIFATSEDDPEDFHTNPANGRSTTFTGLVPGTNYTVRFGSIYTLRRDVDEIEGISFMTTCLVPEITVDDIGYDFVNVSWTAIKGARHYRLYLTSMSTNETDTIDNVVGNRYQLAPLVPTEKYRLGVQVVSMTGQSGQVSEIVTINNAPENPREIVLTNINENRVRVQWERKKDALMYRVTIRDMMNELAPLNENRIKITARNATFFNGLDSGVLYRITIYSLGKANKTDKIRTHPKLFSTMPKPPRSIETSSNITNFLLKWNGIRGAVRYEIFKKSYVINYAEYDDAYMAEPIGENFSLIANSTEAEFRMENLKPASSFVFRIRSVGQFGLKSNFSDSVWVQTLPSKNLAGFVQEISEYHATITWQPTEGVFSYIVLVASDGENVAHHNTRRTKLRLNRLEPGSIYSVSIFPMQIRAGLNINHSENFGFQTIPLPPRDFKINSPNSTTFYVESERVKGAMGYKFVFDAQKQLKNITKSYVIHGSNQGVINGFNPGDVYSVRVHAINFNQEESRSSNVKSMTTRPLPPDQPNVVKFGRTFISLDWNPVRGVDTFELTLSEIINDKTSNKWVINNIENTEIDLKNLYPGMLYSVVLRNENKYHNEGQTSELLYTQTAMDRPKEVSSAQVTTDAVELKWTEIFGADRYLISKLNIDDDEAEVEEYETEATSFQLEDLEPGTLYEFKIKPMSAYHEGEWSVPHAVVTDPLPPSMPSLVSLTSTCAELKWNSTKGAFSYQVSVFNAEESYLNEAMGLESYVCQLTPDTRYNVSVRAVGAAAISMPGPILSIKTALSPPTNLQIQKVEERMAELMWDEIRGATTYFVTLEWTDHVGAPQTRRVESSRNAVELGQLEPNINYKYSVQVLNSDGVLSEMSPKQTFATNMKQQPPIVTSVSSTSLTFTWQLSPAADRYKLIVEGLESDFEARLDAPRPPLTFTDLPAGTRFLCSVVAFSKYDETDLVQSNYTRVQTLTLAPSDLAAEQVGETDITIGWTAAFGAVEYAITVHQNEVKMREVRTRDQNMTLNELRPGTEYLFRVWSIGDGGKMSYEPAQVSESTVPLAPKNVRVTNATASSFALTWEPSSGATDYHVTVQGETTADEEDDIMMTTTSESSLQVEGLRANRVYAVIVYSAGGNARVNPSGSQVLTTRTAPRAPGGLTIYNITDTSVSVKWDHVEGACYYSIAFSKKSTSLGDSPSSDEELVEENRFDTENNNFTLDLLQPSHLYAVSIQTVGMTGLYSDPTPVLPFIAMPSAPNTPRVLNITLDSAHISWDHAEGAVGYVVRMTRMSDDVELMVRTEGNSSLVEDLVSGEEYTLVVQAVGPRGDLSAASSPVVHMQTLVHAPDGFAAYTNDVHLIKLEWLPVYGAAAYGVRVYMGKEIVSEKIVSSTEVVFTQLFAGTNYHFELSSYDQYRRRSKQVRHLEENTLPEQASVFVKTVGSEEITLQWKGVQGAAFYRVFTAGPKIATPSALIANEARVTVTDLNPGEWYTFVVFACDSKNRSEHYGSVPISLQTIASEEEQLLMQQQLSIHHAQKQRDERRVTPEQLGIVLDSPINRLSQTVNPYSRHVRPEEEATAMPEQEESLHYPEEEEERVLVRSRSPYHQTHRSSSFATDSVQCSLQCARSTVVKTFKP